MFCSWDAWNLLSHGTNVQDFRLVSPAEETNALALIDFDFLHACVWINTRDALGPHDNHNCVAFLVALNGRTDVAMTAQEVPSNTSVSTFEPFSALQHSWFGQCAGFGQLTHKTTSLPLTTCRQPPE